MINTTRWWPDTCGCAVEYTWDTTTTEQNRVHTFAAVHNRCPSHVTTPASEALYTVLIEENRRKNLVYQRVVEQFPQYKNANGTLDDAFFQWSFDSARVLTIKVKMTAAEKTLLQAWATQQYGPNKVLVT